MNPKTTYAIAEFSSCGGASESSPGARRKDANAAESAVHEQSSATSHAVDDSVHPTSERSEALPGVDDSKIELLQGKESDSCPDSGVCDGDGNSESITD